MSKIVKCGLIKEFECPDGHVANFWVLADSNYSFNENSETNFNKARLWKQVLVLYNSVNSLIENKMSTWIRRVVYIPFWASNVNDENFGDVIIERIKAIDPFFADAETFEYTIDEANDEPYTANGLIFYSDGRIEPVPVVETIPEPET